MRIINHILDTINSATFSLSTILRHRRHLEHLYYCEKCERWIDARSGCEADIRMDERQIVLSHHHSIASPGDLV